MLKLSQKNFEPKSILKSSEMQLNSFKLENMKAVISSINSVGVLQVANMKINASEWIFAFEKLCEKMLKQNESNYSKIPQMASNLKSLCLINNRKPTIIKSIEFLSFPYLTRLSLDGNKIQSIQSLQFMEMPCLRQLFLYRNFIRSFKPLQKCCLPSLYFVSIYDNLGVNLQKMNRLEHQVSRYWLEREDSKVQEQDISSIVKFPGKKARLTELGIKSIQRILQFKVFDVIQHQNKGIKIIYDIHRQITGEQNHENQQQQ